MNNHLVELHVYMYMYIHMYNGKITPLPQYSFFHIFQNIDGFRQNNSQGF